ncbi:S8 family serine peptidase [Actinoplanes oblitus]|uniref:S8 family serine peptidase n=1 Tax=Actinoplanes oblitus TaxID=3040509 RepID=UPI0038992846
MTRNAGRQTLIALLSLVSTFPATAVAYADAIRDSEWHLAYLQIEAAHAISTGAGVKIGLPDTGTYPHQDIKENLDPGVDLTETRGNRGENDKDGHGTELAGIMVGHGHGRGSADGILGIAPSSHIIPIKAYEAGQQNSRLVNGISLAAHLGAEVINVSAGTSPSRELRKAIDDALKADSVVIAASGNDSNTAIFSYPAALPGVLAVGAIDETGNHASFSIAGPQMGICAPGDDIVTTGLKSTYRKARGTSASTAIVSGAAALVRARFPGLSAREVVHRLTATATDIGAPGWDEQCGYGVLNIVKALTADVPPLDGGSGPKGGTGGASNGTSATASDSHSAGGSRADGRDGGGAGRRVGVLGGTAAVLLGGVLVGFFAARRRSRRRP